jgi:hypothetical protein
VIRATALASSAIGRYRFRDQIHPFCLAGDVDLCGCRLSATGADVRGTPLGVASQDVGDDDLGALDREQASLRLTHAMSAAGDDRNFVFQTHNAPRFAYAAIIIMLPRSLPSALGRWTPPQRFGSLA